jgi:hypothetical protein
MTGKVLSAWCEDWKSCCYSVTDVMTGKVFSAWCEDWKSCCHSVTDVMTGKVISAWCKDWKMFFSNRRNASLTEVYLSCEAIQFSVSCLNLDATGTCRKA